MLQELLSVAAVSVIGAAVYVLFLTSVTWAVELRSSLLNSNATLYSSSAVCRTCGTNFIENCNVEDGKCQICGRILCSRCGLEWICPLCYKKRAQRERENITDEQTQEKLAAMKFMKILKERRFSRELEAGYNKNYSIEQINFNRIINTTYSNNFGKRKTLFPEYGVELPNGNSNNFELKKMNNWEKNWLFKKKANNEVFKPFGMFLPSTNQNTKAQIGGINIDDLSDLSDYGDSEIDDIIN